MTTFDAQELEVLVGPILPALLRSLLIAGIAVSILFLLRRTGKCSISTGFFAAKEGDYASQRSPIALSPLPPKTTPTSSASPSSCFLAELTTRLNSSQHLSSEALILESVGTGTRKPSDSPSYRWAFHQETKLTADIQGGSLVRTRKTTTEMVSTEKVGKDVDREAKKDRSRAENESSIDREVYWMMSFGCPAPLAMKREGPVRAL
ncbi:hypothetical protein M427DRAFT_30256 [Gonapodya prolifera JEL478]|uniref:Uncharacterized protein n=1 Tax=Gonapodya prolifera (strain JEL478) TaxID=1344416 RepID=A0A139AM03_GONPJ|nr:hypothetical protein M427DRAFT_30256 [Gonapodya prolifera JEL478]|eukprot:KXS17802.1 hypothetical protein M427DRAFT_30256 [Gonapodya prolifera JEL478]